jgi:dual-specificity kinase
MPTTSITKQQTSKKRQRSRDREPDWNNFYKNGLPKEVIVIDDSPPPEQSVSSSANGHIGRSVATTNGRHAAKKRRRDDVVYDPVYHNASGSSNNTPQYHSGSGSTISTDRTTSAVHTTAATSLGSNSSNTQNGYVAIDTQPGQKRKRTATRLQLANEAKRKELELNGDAFTSYRPPPRPPIKAPDVQVRVVHDVSSIMNSVNFHTNRRPRTLTQRIPRSMMKMAIIWLFQKQI